MVGLGLLAGLGAGAIDAGLNTYAAEKFSARTLNWLHASFGLGAAIGPIVMSSVISAGQSWRAGFLIVGAAQLVLAGCCALTRNQWHVRADLDHATPPASVPMVRTLRIPSAWLGMLLFFLYTGLELCAGQWLYSLLTEARGMPPAPAGAWVSVYWGSLTVGRLLSGVIVARISVRTLLHLCLFGAMLGVVFLWLNPAPWLALLGVAVLGLSLAPMFPSFISLTSARMGPAHTANAVGFQVAAAMLGGAALVAGFGRIADRFGLEALGPFLLATALLLVGAFEISERHTRRSTIRD
jgi:fucose permease